MTLLDVRCARQIACTLAHFDVRMRTLNSILDSRSRRTAHIEYHHACVYVWRPSAGVPTGSLILQVFALLRCEGLGEGY